MTSGIEFLAQAMLVNRSIVVVLPYRRPVGAASFVRHGSRGLP